jgi:tRNA threonylcarbamoyladenosine biosynthesis protein TsaB
MIWLGIDTANTPLSIAIVQDGILVLEENAGLAINHSLRAMPAIEALLEKAGVAPTQLDAIAVSEGPGSYTGVRIGVTIAKTLAWTLDKPLVGISSLQALAANAYYFNGIICPVFDARRGNVYGAAYRYDNGELTAIFEDGHYSLDELLTFLEQQSDKVLFVGKDAKIHEESIKERLGERAELAPLALNLPRASSLIDLAIRSGKNENTHEFVPQYRRIAEAEANWLKAQKEGKGL